MPPLLSSPSPRPHPQVVARRVGDGAVLIHLPSNRVFELNGTGIRVWELLAGGQTLASVVTTLVSEFEIDAERAGHDVTALLAALDERGLVIP